MKIIYQDHCVNSYIQLTYVRTSNEEVRQDSMNIVFPIDIFLDKRKTSIELHSKIVFI
jgi:hypothetical protein